MNDFSFLKKAEELTSPVSRRSLSPYPRNDTKSKNRNLPNNGSTNITNLINEIESMEWLKDDANSSNGLNSTSSNEVDSKYENASDNGSEISDEGYRSLGLTQQALSNKQTSLKAQSGQEEDVKNDGEFHINKFKIQKSLTIFILATSNEDSQCVTTASSPVGTPDRPESTTPQALRKSGNSLDDPTKKKSPSRIPRSPMARRRSIDTSSPSGQSPIPSTTTGLPVFSRKMPVYRSVRKTTPTDTGRTTQKPIQKQSSADEMDSLKFSGNKKSIAKNPSPKKVAATPLAQQILEVAESAQDDAQMLEKMKQLLNKYKTESGGGGSKGNSPNRKMSMEMDENRYNSMVYGQEMTREQNTLRKTRSNSTISSRDNLAFGNIITDRPVRGQTRIPAPIRQNTELY